MRLALIGMSGSGKSYWSAKLAQSGFKHFCCDALIAARLAPELIGPDERRITLGEWMGFPYQPQYSEREARYLAAETAVLKEIVDCLERQKSDCEGSVVFDMTGSIIYAGDGLLKKLRRQTIIVRMETPPEARESMLQLYLANKRPVVWRGMFEKLPGETNEAALARCYSPLLSSRELLYERLADVTIGYEERSREGFGVTDLLEILRQ